MMIGLMAILLLVLLLPLLSRPVESNLEIFMFAMGVSAASISGVMNPPLFVKAATDPIKITIAVLTAGLLFKWFQKPLHWGISRVIQALSFKLFIALAITVLGILSSMITAIIAALILVVIVQSLPLDRQSSIRFVILGCFSIGLGAALSPIGEPLSTIAISKLGEDFFFLMGLVGPEIIAALVIFGGIAALLIPKSDDKEGLNSPVSNRESYDEIISRSIKVYFFVMGLTLLGEGFEPMINEYFLGLDYSVMYWINMISAILDNATLTAAEVSPAMDDVTIKSILLGLLISGGMLIPGNIPNIIAASKLGITSKEWALFGVPFGLLLMTVYFFAVIVR